MKRFNFLIASAFCTTLFFLACHSKKNINQNEAVKLTETIPGVKISNADRSFRTSATKFFNIDSTVIDIIPSWANTTIDGTVKHYVTVANFTKLDSIVLDAKSMTIERVVVNGTESNFKITKYKLNIILPKQLGANEKAQIDIKYLAKPNEKEKGGSASIKNDKGFYFINSKGEDKYKPIQAWTQGETEANSCWFPTVDKPNHKSCFRVMVTVPDTFTSLGNGRLISSIKLGNGLRKDEWLQNKPMSAYLVMLAIGKFSKVPATLNPTVEGKNIPVDYYVEPEYASAANEIFARTPEMIEFFSTRLGVAFPWDKYSQVVCRDYVSGAMENTSASLFGEFVQHDHRGMIDNDNDGIVAHELFHQWFGDLITCENWSHLTVNESFASYGEYLWAEHKGNKEQMEKAIYNDVNRYLKFSETIDHPIVYHYYKDKEDMFSPIIYRKGARVLHLLRHELGDDIFFAGLKYFLTKHQYQAVESDQLRLAMEEISGRDLRWFWEQWFYKGSHPNLALSYKLVQADTIDAKPFIEISYKQTCDSNYVFNFPISFMVKGPKEIITKKYTITKASGVLKLPIAADPLAQTSDFIIYSDVDNLFIGKIVEEQLPEQWYKRLVNTESYIQQRRALKALQTPPLSQEYLTKGIQFALSKNECPQLQSDIISGLDFKNAGLAAFWKGPIIGIAKTSKNAKTLAASLRALSSLAKPDEGEVFLEHAQHESYSVAEAALSGLFKVDTTKALQIVHQQKYNYNELTNINVALLCLARVDTCTEYYKEAIAHQFGGDRLQSILSLDEFFAKKPSRALLNTYWDVLKKYRNDEVEYIGTNVRNLIKALAESLDKDSSKVSASTVQEIKNYADTLPKK
jgi:aminopeptidase N